MVTEKHTDPRRPPLGAEPGTLPKIHTTRVPYGALIWGMVPLGVGCFGTAGKNQKHKANIKCPSCEYLVCFAFVNSVWHEVTREVLDKAPEGSSDYDKALAAVRSASGASNTAKWAIVSGPETGVGNEFYLQNKTHGTYYVCVDQGEVTACSPCTEET